MLRHPLLTALALTLGAPLAAEDRAPAPAPLLPGETYVALGSSYAAGPGVGSPAEGPARCGRGRLAYPELVARRLSLTLVNATCSGSTTENILRPWAELPPQIEAVTAATRLVTITSGGNDVGFVRNLYAAACLTMPRTARPGNCPSLKRPSEADWQGVEARLHQIDGDVRRRAPMARVVFVDYPAIVPEQGRCAALQGSAADLAASRAEAHRLAAITARVAQGEGADLVRASQITRRHTPCAADPWSYGTRAPAGGVPVHPRPPAHAAIAEALVALLAPKAGAASEPPR